MGFFNINTPSPKRGTTKGFYFGQPEAEAEFSIKGQTLAEYFDVDYNGAHRGLKDVEITYEVYNKLKNI